MMVTMEEKLCVIKTIDVGESAKKVAAEMEVSDLLTSTHRK